MLTVPGSPFSDAPVVESATSFDVKGKEVAGNLPLHLAALAKSIWAVEFVGTPPRGQEYGLAEMDAAGAYVHPYRVVDKAVLVTQPKSVTHSPRL